VSLSPDTNLLVYAQDGREPIKQRIALQLLDALAASGRCVVALQVVGELFTVLTRRLKAAPGDACDSALSNLRLFDAFAYDEADVQTALTLAADGIFSYWDGLLVASASKAGCRYLISEDMQDGFRYGELEIVSPFSDGRANPRLLDALGQ